MRTNHAPIMVAIVGQALMPVTGAVAQEDPVEAALEACKPEIETFCSQVTPKCQQAMKDVELGVVEE